MIRTLTAPNLLSKIIFRSLDSCNRNEAHNSITYLFPPNFALISALVATAKKYKWTKAIVLEKQSDGEKKTVVFTVRA